MCILRGRPNSAEFGLNPRDFVLKIPAEPLRIHISHSVSTSN
jgi:hypothetical protein